MRRGSSLARATGLVGLLVAGLAVPPVLGSLPAAESAPYGLQVAFTDDRDELVSVGVTRDFGGPDDSERLLGSPAGLEAGGPVHTGEASYMPADVGGDGSLLFVSTRGGDLDGEVYRRTDGEDVQVTCENAATETHPVPSPFDDRVAYASDISGNWDLYIATPVEAGSESLPPVGGVCAGYDGRRVTEDPGDDLWPAWSSTGDHLVFSSTRSFRDLLDDGPPVADPLGDLFLIEVDGTEPESQVQRLTQLSGADTQPAVTPDSADLSQPLVAFTSTRDRPDGSLSLLELPDPGQDVLPLVHPAWPEGPLQAGEPAWAPSTSGLYLAWTSTEYDLLGDVWAGQVSRPGSVPPSMVMEDAVAGTPGVAESHPTWRNEFDQGSEDDDAELVLTRRSEDADISEALAADGSGRRVMVSHTDGDPLGEGLFVFDEAGPSYSPNGQRVAYSRDLSWFNPEEDVGRQLVVEDVDGTTPVPILADRGLRDVDLDPVWSPDGTRLAFTRFRSGQGGTRPSVWVVDLADPDTAVEITPQPAEGLRLYDVDPTWSPDGTRLALVRTQVDVGAELGVEDFVSGPRAAPIPVPGTPELWVVDAADGGNPVGLRYLAPCPPVVVAACPSVVFTGDSPAWSPDGMSIAYRTAAAIRLLRLGDARATGPAPVVSHSSVTGFAVEAGGAPTPSRDRISAADDPAWSPDGSEIAFAGQPAGQPDQRGIYAVGPDGSGLRVIAQDRGPETQPAYGFRPPPPPPADVAVALTLAGDPAVSGDPITATYTVSNNGPGSATGVTLTTDATAGGTRSSTTPGCSGDGTGCGPRTLAPGESYVYEVILTYDDDVDGLATGSVSTGSVDPDLSNNRVEVPFTVRRPADVAVTLVLTGTPALVDEPVTATYTVTNHGPGTALGTTLVTGFTAGGTAASTTAGCSADGTGCPARDLAPGETYDYVVTVTYPVEVDGTADGTVATTSSDPDLANNTVDAPFQVSQPADVAVDLTITGSPAEVGGPVTASYSVTNLGPGDAEGVVLATGFSPGGEATSSTPDCSADGSGCPARGLGSGESFEYTVTLTHDTDVAGFATGVVTATTADPDLGNNAVEEPYLVGGAEPPGTPRADVRVDVQVDRELGWVGGSRTATITVTNAGPRLALAAELEPTYPGTVRVTQAPLTCLQTGTGCELGVLMPGETREFEVELRLRRRGLGDIAATVSSATVDPRPGNNADAVTLVIRKPVIRLLPSVGRPGQVVLAYGEQFPPGTGVEVAWDVGVTAHRGPFRVARDGTLRVPLLLIRHDRLGSRELTVRSLIREFSPVGADALVVPRLLSPPSFLSRG